MQQSQKPPKKKQKKACECGAWTHATTRSKLCPLNKKYNRVNKDKEAAKKMVMEGAARRAAALSRRAAVEVTADEIAAVEVTEDESAPCAPEDEVTEDESAPRAPEDEVTEDVPITPPEPVRQLYEEGEMSPVYGVLDSGFSDK